MVVILTGLKLGLILRREVRFISAVLTEAQPVIAPIVCNQGCPGP